VTTARRVDREHARRQRSFPSGLGLGPELGWRGRTSRKTAGLASSTVARGSTTTQVSFRWRRTLIRSDSPRTSRWACGTGSTSGGLESRRPRTDGRDPGLILRRRIIRTQSGAASLAHALDDFRRDPRAKRASTSAPRRLGFNTSPTSCCRAARRADESTLDVGHGQLHWGGCALRARLNVSEGVYAPVRPDDSGRPAPVDNRDDRCLVHFGFARLTFFLSSALPAVLTGGADGGRARPAPVRSRDATKSASTGSSRIRCTRGRVSLRVTADSGAAVFTRVSMAPDLPYLATVNQEFFSASALRLSAVIPVTHGPYRPRGRGREGPGSRRPTPSLVNVESGSVNRRRRPSSIPRDRPR